MTKAPYISPVCIGRAIILVSCLSNIERNLEMSIVTEKRSGPLNGYKILDFTRALAGPYGTMMLADMGATVIKIEAPDGDFTRTLGPFTDNETKDNGLGGFFSSVNRNKEDLVLNLKTVEAQEIAQKLAMECDAVISNYSSVKILEKYNLGYEKLHELNPKLVYVVISGYGTDKVVGTEVYDKPTVDLMIQAHSGIMSITGLDKDHMCKVGPGIGDTYPGTLSIVALLAALIHAKDTGEGQYVEVAMMDAMMLLCERMIYQYSYTGVVPEPMGNDHPLQAPWSLYKTADGYVAIAGSPIKYWEHFLEAADYAPLRDEKFATAAGRVTYRDELNAVIGEWTKQYTTDACMEILNKFNCLAAPVCNAADLFNSKQVEKREMLAEVEANVETGAKVKIAGVPFKFSETPAKVYKRAPLLGENSREILHQLGYSDAQIDAFQEKNVTLAR